MEISIDKEDLNEIENKMPELTNWLANNFVNLNSVCFILQSIIDKVKEAKKEIDNEWFPGII